MENFSSDYRRMAAAGILAALVFDPGLGSKRESRGPAVMTPVEKSPAGRNDPCPCGSGKKFKRCCRKVG